MNGNKKINLLIIEDDPNQVFLITESLNREKFEISTIQDGREAFKYLDDCIVPPDLILLDYHLPSMDGLEIMHSLREKGKKYNIVFLTADYSIETAIKSINSGALEFIPKNGKFVTNISAVMEKAYEVVLNKLEKGIIEKALMESEERFKTVLEASRDGIFEWDGQSGTAYISPNNAYMLDFDPAEFSLTYSNWFTIIHPDDVQILYSKLNENNFNLYEAEIRVLTKKGDYKWILERGIVVNRSSNGSPSRVIGTRSDISQRKSDEQKIIEANRKLTTLVDNLPGIVYRSRVDNSFTKEFISERVFDITGFKAESFLDNSEFSFIDIIHPDDRDKVIEELSHAVTNDLSYDLYFRIITKNNTIKWISDHGKCIANPGDQKIIALEGYMADITDQKQSGEALKRSEEEKNIILDNSLQSFILLNNEGEIISFNRIANYRAIIMAGKNLIKGKNISEFSSDSEKEKIKTSIEKAKSGEPVFWTIPFKTKKINFWFENVMIPIFTSNEEVKFISFTSSDITERRQAEEKIIHSENLYNTAINAINDPIHVVDKDLHILLANQALLSFNQRFNFEKNIIGQKITNVYPFLNENHITQYKSVFDSGKTEINEETYLVADRIFFTETKIIPVFQKDKVVRAVTTIHDITERKNFEKKIMNAIIETEEKERKRFSEDLHDELGSLLSTIKIYINTLYKEDIDPKKQAEMVDFTNDLINQAIQNSKEIANNLSPNVIKRFGLISAIQSFCQKIEMPEQMHIDFTADGYKHKLREDEEISVYRIITELINNTIKHADAHKINISMESSGNKLMVTYADNGKGFNFKQVLKQNKKGLGLQNIITRINSLNGSYTIKSEENKGFFIGIEMILDDSVRNQ